MFDFFLFSDYGDHASSNSLNISFVDLPYYSNLKSVGYRKKLTNGFAEYLERRDTTKGYFCAEAKHVFLYGSAFTDNDYASSRGVKPVVLNAENLFGLYKEFGLGVAESIKGSFVIVIYDDNSSDCVVITDRLNVLPLYYFFDNKRLVISSSLRLMLNTQFSSGRIDGVALTQQLIFDYTLADRTYYEDIKRVLPGSIYTFKKNRMAVDRYWDVEHLYHAKLLSRGESLDLLAEQLFENVQLYTSDTDKVLVSLTGGFDGRTNLAMLRKPKDAFLCYSYGMPASRQISVPTEISNRLNVPYRPVYCHTDFEHKYIDSASKVVEFSNGTAPYTQAVFPYAFSKLSKFSDTVLTGLFGSEVLRPLHNLGIIINEYSQKIFLGQDMKKEVGAVLDELSHLDYIERNIIDGAREELTEEIYNAYVERFRGHDRITRFFLFTIEEGIRKYFSQEIQSERVYVTNRFPYFDDDFVELIYRTPFAGMYNGFLGESKFKRRKGQLLYARIMKRYFPELLNVRLDRGYKPRDLIRPFPINFFVIGAQVYRTRNYKSRVGNDTFNTPKWSVEYLSNAKKSFVPDGVFKRNLIQFGELNEERKRLKFAHLLSIYNYMHNE